MGCQPAHPGHPLACVRRVIRPFETSLMVSVMCLGSKEVIASASKFAILPGQMLVITASTSMTASVSTTTAQLGSLRVSSSLVKEKTRTTLEFTSKTASPGPIPSPQSPWGLSPRCLTSLAFRPPVTAVLSAAQRYTTPSLPRRVPLRLLPRPRPLALAPGSLRITPSPPARQGAPVLRRTLHQLPLVLPLASRALARVFSRQLFSLSSLLPKRRVVYGDSGPFFV